MQLEILSRQQVLKLQQHKQIVVICNVAFDVSDYMVRHPGGKTILKAMSVDGFECMVKHHRKNLKILKTRLSQTAIGVLRREDRT